MDLSEMVLVGSDDKSGTEVPGRSDSCEELSRLAKTGAVGGDTATSRLVNICTNR